MFSAVTERTALQPALHGLVGAFIKERRKGRSALVPEAPQLLLCHSFWVRPLKLGRWLRLGAAACLEALNGRFPTASLKVFAFLAGVNAVNLCFVILLWLRKKRLIPW